MTIRLHTYRPGGYGRAQAHEALRCAGGRNGPDTFWSVTIRQGRAPEVERLPAPTGEAISMAYRLGLIVGVTTGERLDIEGCDTSYRVAALAPLTLEPLELT